MFERFYRAEESRSQAIEGSGLGLAITKSIIDLHHGNISARVEAGWTIFQITLPRIQVVQNGGE
ncbi:ATP-binding protein [Dolosigranulum pigrum]|uniref:ATP-binding protein n=1 Tax=Dolosigranulum pigrum TaxID=29394 RepID=UPI001FCB2EE8|nr:ATP-binding protein [Dolosigranulum pigrum]